MTHPMTPPLALLSKWEDGILKRYENVDVQLLKAYQAGADAELNACCVWIESLSRLVSHQLRAARRPKPSPLQQALDACATALAAGRLSPDEASLIRIALEANS